MRYKSVAQFFVHSWMKGVPAEDFFDSMEASGISRLESQEQLETLKDKGFLQIETLDDTVMIRPLKDRKEFKKLSKADSSDKGVKPIKIISLE